MQVGKLARRMIRKIYSVSRNTYDTIPRIREISTNQILQGGENGIRSREYSILANDFTRPSTQISEGPHVDFLSQYDDVGDLVLQNPLFQSTEYYLNACKSIEICGNYFEAHEPEQVLAVAKRFIERYVTGVFGDGDTVGVLQSPIGKPIEVTKIQDSSCYEIIDGNHRAAILMARGAKSIKVKVFGFPSITPLQQLLNSTKWVESRPEIYQPISAPEIKGHWVLIRKCTDRLDKMNEFLQRLPAKKEVQSYLDIGSYFGWFVAEMGKKDFDSYGIERDPVAASVGTNMYGIMQNKVYIGECQDVLKSMERKFDVVSFFSVLHHFELGEVSVSSEELIQRIDAITNSVLFFDTGQGHEQWFRDTLGKWNPDFIEDWIQKNTSFTKIERLGIDEDSGGQFSSNYGRMLFACTR